MVSYNSLAVNGRIHHVFHRAHAAIASFILYTSVHTWFCTDQNQWMYCLSKPIWNYFSNCFPNITSECRQQVQKYVSHSANWHTCPRSSHVETGVRRAFVSTYPLVHKAAGDWNCGTGNEFWVHRWSKMYWNPQDQKNGLSHSLLDSEVRGALVQSRFQDVTEMDAPSSFFFRLKKKHEQSKAFRSLLSDEGQERMEFQIRRLD